MLDGMDLQSVATKMNMTVEDTAFLYGLTGIIIGFMIFIIMNKAFD
jgi:hypothetical protein